MRTIFTAADLADAIANTHRLLASAGEDFMFGRVARGLIRNCRLSDAEIAAALEDLDGRLPAKDLGELIGELDAGFDFDFGLAEDSTGAG